MGANEGAHIALQALILIPNGQMGGNAALFILRGTQRHGAVLHIHESGDRQVITLLGIDRHQDVLDNVGQILIGGLDGSAAEMLPAILHLDFHNGIDTGIHSLQVHVDDLLALQAVGLLDGSLHVLHGVFNGDDIGQLEEGRLQHHVGAIAQAQRLRFLIGVDDVELDVVLGDVLENIAGHLLLQLILGPLAVEQEGAVGLQLGDNIVLGQICLVVAGHEVRVADIICRADRLLAEPQMALGDTEGLLGIVLEVRLAVHIGGIADDLDGVFVGADGTVRAKAPELAGDGAFRLGQQCRADGQGQHGHIVLDTDGEMILGRIQQQVIEHGLDLSGGGILGGQAVTAGIDHGAVAVIDVSGANIFIQRLADGTDLLHAVEDSDLLDGLGHRGQQMLGRERTEQVYLQEADLLTLGVEVIDHFLNRTAHAAHCHDHALGIRCAVVIEQVIFTAGQLGDLSHVILDDVRQLVVRGVVGLTKLEVDIGVIDQRTHTGIFGVQCVGAEGSQRVVIHQLGKIGILQPFHLLNLVAGTEAIEEMQEGDACLDGRQMCHTGQIHNLLYAAGRQHGETGLTAVHHIGMVAKDGERVGTNGTGSHVQHAGQTLTGDTVHGGDHQHQALRCGKGSSQCTGFQRTVASTAGAGLGLHFHQANALSENVFLTFCRPLVGMLRHGRGRGDRVDCGDFGEGIRHVCGSFVTVADLHDLTHLLFLLLSILSSISMSTIHSIQLILCLFYIFIWKMSICHPSFL